VHQHDVDMKIQRLRFSYAALMKGRSE